MVWIVDGTGQIQHRHRSWHQQLRISVFTAHGRGESEVLAIPQWDTASTVTESFTLPSFLYLPEEAVATQIRGRGLSCGEWAAGRLAQRKASETPGRVAHSAKSWLCHHAADRSAPFLPWGSDDLTQREKISPVFALALTLKHLRAAWDARFAGQGQGFQFDTQEITITVPASFGAAAHACCRAGSGLPRSHASAPGAAGGFLPFAGTTRWPQRSAVA